MAPDTIGANPEKANSVESPVRSETVSPSWGPEPDVRLIQWAADALTLRYFPWGVFDEGTGLIRDPVAIPDDYKRSYQDAQKTAGWQEIQLQLNLLQTPIWACHSVAVGFTQRGISILPVKSLGSVGDPGSGGMWAGSFHERILANIQTAAGTMPAIPPAWITAITEVLKLIQKYTGGQLAGLEAGEAPPLEVTYAINVGFVVRLLLDLVDLAAKARINKNAYGVTLWYSNSYSPMTPQDVGRWAPIGLVRLSGVLSSRNATGVVWDLTGKKIWAWPGPSGPWGPNEFPFNAIAIRQVLYPGGVVESPEQMLPEPC
jgi:hypothetical protein